MFIYNIIVVVIFLLIRFKIKITKQKYKLYLKHLIIYFINKQILYYG